LFDGRFAARVAALEVAPALPSDSASANARPESERLNVEAPPAGADAAKAATEAASVDGALALLALFQREGRLVDFLQQDVTAFADAEVGAAARLVHAGCQRVLKTHARVEALRTEAEGSAVSVSSEQMTSVKLVGNVSGSAPYRGTLRHRGWRIKELALPTRIGGQDSSVIAEAEVEL
jgi:hypothetical protein